METIPRRGPLVTELTILVLVANALACKGGGTIGKDAARLSEGGRPDTSGEPPIDTGGEDRDASGDLPVGPPDGGDRPDASDDGPAAPTDGSTDTTVAACDWGVFNEGILGISVVDDGGNVIACYETPCSFDFTINEQKKDSFMSADLWYFALLGSGTVGTSTVAQLEFHMPTGWDVTWSAGQTVRVLNLLRVLPYPVPTYQEFPVQAHLSLRDSAGKLLLLSAPEVPLGSNGQALLDSMFAPEVSVAWKGLGCPEYRGPDAQREGMGRLTVGVVVRDVETGREAMATWGHNATLQVRGEAYVLSVNQGYVYPDGIGWGRAAFTLYREGYLYRP